MTHPLTSSGSRIVVVGGSLAGLHAAEALRENGFAGSVTVLSGEKDLPYDRPPLSKQVLSGEWSPDRSALRQASQLAEAGIDVWSGVAATALDLTQRRVRTDGGDQVTYDGLVIATGCAARTLPGVEFLEGVHTLRTLDDCLSLRRELVGGARLVIVGAGFIGLEVAACARGLGADVTVVEPQQVPLRGAVGATTGELLAQVHRDHGVRFRLGRGVRRLHGKSAVAAVELDDRSVLPADAVLVGIGAVPAVDWLADSGLEIDNGVVCAAHLGAGPSGVVAAGDVARWPNELFGEKMRVEHWSNAVDQGRAAAQALLTPGQRVPFSTVPYFWSDQYDLRVQSAGRAGDEVVTLIVDPDFPRCLVVSGRGGTLTSAVSLNLPKLFIKARRMIAKRVPLEEAVTELKRFLARL